MAFRKAKVKEQFDRTIAGVLEPGERVEAVVLSQSGPTPWAMGAVGVLLMLVAGMRYYLVAATDRRVLFMTASMWTTKPKKLAWADPRGAGQLFDVEAGAVLWSHFKYLRPGERKPIRFNVHRIWRDDLQTLLAAMTAPRPGAGAMPPPPPPSS